MQNHQPQSLPARKLTVARLKPIHELLIARALLHPRIPALTIILHLQRQRITLRRHLQRARQFRAADRDGREGFGFDVVDFPHEDSVRVADGDVEVVAGDVFGALVPG